MAKLVLINTVNSAKLSKGNNGFAVHAADCADLAKALKTLGVHKGTEADTLDELAKAFNDDMVAGGFEPGEWDFDRDVKLFACATTTVTKRAKPNMAKLSESPCCNLFPHERTCLSALRAANKAARAKAIVPPVNEINEVVPGRCRCGCGAAVDSKRNFRQGHDQRLVGLLRKGTVPAEAKGAFLLTFHNGEFARLVS